MAQNLLPIRILFHAAFALVYLPTIALTFAFKFLAGLISLSALVGLGAFAALDILTIHRNVNQKTFLFIDLFVAICLPVCMYPMIRGGISAIGDLHGDYYVTYSGLGELGFPLEITATVTLLGLSTSYVMYIVISAVIDRVRGNEFLPRHPDESPPSSFSPPRKLFLGCRRTPAEQTAITDHCASYIFQRSVFRKHAFEPTGWAIFRGIIAVYCFVGLLVVIAYSGYSGGEEYKTAGLTLQETVVSSSDVQRSFATNFLSVAMLSPSQSIPSDVKVARSGNTPLIQTVTASDSQFWSEDVLPGDPNGGLVNPYPSSGYPFIEDNDFNVTWSGAVTVNIWIMTFGTPGSTNSTQAVYSPSFSLVPYKQYDIDLAVISYKMNDLSWLFLEPHIRSDVASGSNTTSANFSCSWQAQRQITHRVLSSSSGLVLFAHALSEIGGVYAFLDGVFALLFGRTIMGILFGTRAISPFGVLGMVTRNRFRRLINEQYPRLQEDVERGGMAAFISEVAIDPGLVLTSTSAHIRARVSTSSHGSHTGSDADDAGIIHLRSMESSDENKGHCRLPYVIEEYEPPRKENCA